MSIQKRESKINFDNQLCLKKWNMIKYKFFYFIPNSAIASLSGFYFFFDPASYLANAFLISQTLPYIADSFQCVPFKRKELKDEIIMGRIYKKNEIIET